MTDEFEEIFKGVLLVQFEALSQRLIPEAGAKLRENLNNFW
jgi:hypothetical protein